MPSDDLHQQALEETGFWGRQGAGCLIVAKSTGRILWPKRSKAVLEPGTWGTWGGAIDPSEQPKKAALRELKEECGYVGKVIIKPLLVFKSGSFSYHNFLTVVPEEFKPRLDWETEKAEWRKLEDAPKPLHLGLKALLKDPASLKIIKQYTNQEHLRPDKTQIQAAFRLQAFCSNL